jgi:hypothetical protein
LDGAAELGDVGGLLVEFVLDLEEDLVLAVALLHGEEHDDDQADQQHQQDEIFEGEAIVHLCQHSILRAYPDRAWDRRRRAIRRRRNSG